MHVVHFHTLEDRLPRVPVVYHPAYEEPFQRMFSELCRSCGAEKSRDYACIALLYRILAQANEDAQRAAQDPATPRMRAARIYMESHFDDSALSVAVLAAQAGVSPTYFRREFQRCFGTTPSGYLRRLRMDHAKLLLQTGYYPVSEVALRCGFDQISYFSQVFHADTGITPSAYARLYAQTP